MFSEILGLMELLDICIFKFIYLLGRDLRSENGMPLQHNVTLAQIYINPKILLTILIGYNLWMSVKLLANLKILHSWYIKRLLMTGT